MLVPPSQVNGIVLKPFDLSLFSVLGCFNNLRKMAGELCLVFSEQLLGPGRGVCVGRLPGLHPYKQYLILGVFLGSSGPSQEFLLCWMAMVGLMECSRSFHSFSLKTEDGDFDICRCW